MNVIYTQEQQINAVSLLEQAKNWFETHPQTDLWFAVDAENQFCNALSEKAIAWDPTGSLLRFKGEDVLSWDAAFDTLASVVINESAEDCLDKAILSLKKRIQ